MQRTQRIPQHPFFSTQKSVHTKTHSARRLALRLCVWLALLIVGATAGGPQPAQAGPLAQREGAITNLDVDKTTVAQQTPFLVGDEAVFATRLENTSRGEREIGFVERIAWPLRLAGPVEVAVFAGEVSSRRVAVSYERLENGGTDTVVAWRGVMASATDMELRIPVQVQTACRAGQTERTLTAQAMLRAYNARGQVVEEMTVADTYTVLCPQLASLDDIQVVLEILTDRPAVESTTRAGDAGMPTEELFGAYNFLLARARITNSADQSVVVGHRLTSRYIGETEKNIDSSRAGDATTSAHDGYYTPVLLRPGESRTVEVWTDMRPKLAEMLRSDAQAMLQRTPEGTFVDFVSELQAEFSFHYLLLPAVQARLEQVKPDPAAEIRQAVHNIRMRAWDVGDAPASSNHAAVAMTAYPSVTAHFPTVFNPALDPNFSGPAHARPRYFHLGRGVSPEVDADLGPTPNIHPAADVPDRDTYDDGVNLSLWQLNHCTATTIDVRIFISAQAATWFAQNGLRGVLNGWIDSDRSGDWRGVFDCEDGKAFEHFIIDHPIDVVGLGAGYHTIAVPTGLVHWPDHLAQSPAWVRITLSELPSTKIASEGPVAYGDGRGPGRPYFLGETEDYLLRPTGSQGSGPDLEITLDGFWQDYLTLITDEGAGDAAHLAATDFTFQKIEWTFVADVRNRGTATATGAQVVMTLPPEFFQVGSLTKADMLDVLTAFRYGSEGELVQSAVIEDNRVLVNLEPLEPGERGMLLLRFQSPRQLVEALGSEIIVHAKVSTPVDETPEGRVNSFTVEITGAGFAGESLLFKSPTSPFWVQDGTSNSRQLAFRGFIPTGETALFAVDDDSGKLVLDRIANRGYVHVWIHSLLDAARTDMEDEAAVAGEYLAPGVFVQEVSVRADGTWDFELTDLADGFYQIAVGHPAACDAGLAGNDNEWRNRPGRQSQSMTCARVVVDTRLPIDPISLGFVEVPQDKAQAVNDDGTVNGRVFLPETLNWSAGEWHVDLPPGELTAVFHAVDDLKIGAGDGSVLILRIDDVPHVAQVETAIPALYQAKFFFDEADALFGASTAELVERELWLRLEVDEQTVEFAGRLQPAQHGFVLPLVPAPEAINTLLYVLQSRDGKNFVLWDGSRTGQPNPVIPDAEGRYSLILPRGTFQLLAHAQGYETYRSALLSGGGPVAEKISLRRAIDDPPTRVIILDQDGMTPALTTVKPGEVIQFVSMDDIPRLLSIRVEPGLNPDEPQPGPEPSARMAQAGETEDDATLRSSQLLLGDSFVIQVGASGALVVEDENSPGIGGRVQIAQPGDPTEPGPGDPTEPGPDPTEPGPDPTEPEPSDPTEPGDPSDPGDPTEPGDPSDPSPSDPNQPEDPDQPGEASTPSLFVPHLAR